MAGQKKVHGLTPEEAASVLEFDIELALREATYWQNARVRWASRQSERAAQAGLVSQATLRGHMAHCAAREKWWLSVVAECRHGKESKRGTDSTPLASLSGFVCNNFNRQACQCCNPG